MRRKGAEAAERKSNAEVTVTELELEYGKAVHWQTCLTANI
jgi:hypothetical protein